MCGGDYGTRFFCIFLGEYYGRIPYADCCFDETCGTARWEWLASAAEFPEGGGQFPFGGRAVARRRSPPFQLHSVHARARGNFCYTFLAPNPTFHDSGLPFLCLGHLELAVVNLREQGEGGRERKVLSSSPPDTPPDPHLKLQGIMLTAGGLDCLLRGQRVVQ